MKYSCTIKIRPDEYWWGGSTHDGIDMPFSAADHYRRVLDPSESSNQVNPLLLSSKGRYIWSDRGFCFAIEGGMLRLESDKAPIELFEGYGNLKGAYRAASARHFPPSGVMPPEDFFTVPQYNTWIELVFNQNQADILAYAHGVIEGGMPPGILMIDNGWQEYHGNWMFHSGRFPEPREMLRELHELGFKVMVWLVPLVTADTLAFRELQSRGGLVRDAGGNTAIRRWWDGYSAVLDMTNPDTAGWLTAQLKELMREYGVDGFKFDGGDPSFYRDDDITHSPVDANGHCETWAMFGRSYPYNEYRACFKCAGQPLVQRLCDKNHEWAGSFGLEALVPNTLAQGVTGFLFNCADMIGGGEYVHFWQNRNTLDQELFVRYAQCTALMPMMQFSAAPWRVLDRRHYKACLDAVKLHEEYAPRILELAREAARTNEPISRWMEYVYPGQGFHDVRDQFMLGNDILVAPVMVKGLTQRPVRLPPGAWRLAQTGQVFDGPQTISIPVTLESLPFFIRKGADNNDN